MIDAIFEGLLARSRSTYHMYELNIFSSLTEKSKPHALSQIELATTLETKDKLNSAVLSKNFDERLG